MPKARNNIEGDAQSAETTLNLLNAIGEDAAPTQRTLSKRLGVALGLTNALVKRCVSKGLIKVKNAPARRYAYYLTPKGFKEKANLTAEFLSCSLNFFRMARSEYDDAIQYCKNRGWKRVALYGASELAEIALLSAINEKVQILCVIAPGVNETQFYGMAVLQGVSELLDVDAIIITDTAHPQEIYDQLIKSYSADKVIAPKLLHVMPSQSDVGTGED